MPPETTAGAPPRDSPQGRVDTSTRQPVAGGSALGVLPTIAHELRGPIHTLVATAEILVNDVERLHRQQIRQMVTTIHQQSLWLHGLVENLLAAATIFDGHFHLQPRPMSLAYAVAEIEPIIAPLLAQKRQRLPVSVEEPVSEVLADSRRIGQVLVNLIQNASKFSPPETAVDVAVAVRADFVRVTVADRGPGLPPEGAQHLFAPFVRHVRPEQGAVEGVGLGLAVVRHIVEAHGGRVGAEPRPGGGAQFWFELPALPR